MTFRLRLKNTKDSALWPSGGKALSPQASRWEPLSWVGGVEWRPGWWQVSEVLGRLSLAPSLVSLGARSKWATKKWRDWVRSIILGRRGYGKRPNLFFFFSWDRRYPYHLPTGWWEPGWRSSCRSWAERPTAQAVRTPGVQTGNVPL